MMSGLYARKLAGVWLRGFTGMLGSWMGFILSQSAFGAEPLLVLTKQEPWDGEIGSHSPYFALFDDGSVIYVPQGKLTKAGDFCRVIVDANQTQLAASPPTATPFQSHYRLSHWSDQLTTWIWTPRRRIEIYGNWDYARIPALATRLTTAMDKLDILPEEILKGLRWIEAFRAKPGPQ